MKKVLVVLVVLVVAILVLTGCSNVSKSINTANDVKDKRVVTVAGTNTVSYINHNLPNATLIESKSFDSAVEILKSNKADCIIFDKTILGNINESDEELTILSDVLSTESYALAVAKGNKELLDEVNQFIDKIELDGTLTDMVERWVVKADTKLPKIDIKGGKGEIKIGIPSDLYLPTCAKVDGEYTGIAVELANRFASENGYELKLVVKKISELMDAVNSGEIDIISSDLTVSNERASKVDFSRVYYKSSLGIMKLTNPPTNAVFAAIGGFFTDIGESINSTFIIENRWELILEGLLVTVIISVCSLIFGTILGGCICALRRSKKRFISGIAKVYIRIMQGIPVVIMLMILFYAIFASVDIDAIIVSIIGFSMNFAAYSSEMFRTGIDSVDKGQLEAARATGFNKLQTFIFIVLPQALRQIIPVFRGEFINMVKMTSVVGYIAIQDLTKMSDIIRSRTYEAFFPLIVTAIIYFIITYLFVIVLNYIDKIIDPKLRKRVVKGVSLND